MVKHTLSHGWSSLASHLPTRQGDTNQTMPTPLFTTFSARNVVEVHATATSVLQRVESVSRNPTDYALQQHTHVACCEYDIEEFTIDPRLHQWYTATSSPMVFCAVLAEYSVEMPSGSASVFLQWMVAGLQGLLFLPMHRFSLPLAWSYWLVRSVIFHFKRVENPGTKPN